MIHKVCCLTRPNPGASRRTFLWARPRRAYLIPLEETFVGRAERRRAYVGTIKGQKRRWGPFSTFPNTQWPFESMGVLNISRTSHPDAQGSTDISSWEECSKKSIQQGRSHFGARSVQRVREHGKMVRTPLVAFFNIPSIARVQSEGTARLKFAKAKGLDGMKSWLKLGEMCDGGGGGLSVKNLKFVGFSRV